MHAYLPQFIKFFHVMIGVIFLGLMIATYFYITNSLRYNDSQLKQYALKTSFFADAFILIIILTQFGTGGYLAAHNHLTIDIPWVRAAYIFFSLVTLLWIANFFVKLFNYRHADEKFSYRYLFHTLNILIIVILIAITHDAIMQKTFLHF